jgi:hypothetical protein
MEENVPQLQIDRQYCTVFYIKAMVHMIIYYIM